MPKDVSTPDFAQEQLLYNIIKESDVPPGSWCAFRSPEPEAQSIVLDSGTQPEEQPAAQPADQPAAQPAEQPTEKPAEQPEQPEQPADQPADQPAEKATS